MTDLAAWLLEQITDDERVADDEDRQYANTMLGPEIDSEHQGRWDTDRVRAECAAKRRIVALHQAIRPGIGPSCGSCYYDDYGVHGLDRAAYPCETLRLLTLPYADRPGYPEEWKP